MAWGWMRIRRLNEISAPLPHQAVKLTVCLDWSIWNSISGYKAPFQMYTYTIHQAAPPSQFTKYIVTWHFGEPLKVDRIITWLPVGWAAFKWNGFITLTYLLPNPDSVHSNLGSSNINVTSLIRIYENIKDSLLWTLFHRRKRLHTSPQNCRKMVAHLRSQ